MERVVCAAIKVNLENDEFILPCVRHGFGFQLLRKLGIKGKTTQGFLTNKNSFLNRTQALSLCKENGQLPETVVWSKIDQHTDELFSEDLY